MKKFWTSTTIFKYLTFLGIISLMPLVLAKIPNASEIVNIKGKQVMFQQGKQRRSTAQVGQRLENKNQKLIVSGNENAQTITQEAYLNAVRSAKETIEKNQLLDPKKIEHSVEMIQKDTQKNWQKTVDEITALGDRLQEAAQAAWDILMKKENSDKK